MVAVQSQRRIAVETPLGEDAVLLGSFHGCERLSEPFEYELELLVPAGGLDLNRLLGQNVTVRIELRDGERYLNGFVQQIGESGREGRYVQYRAVVSPWLWFLTRMSDCRIYQGRSIPDILKQVFRGHGFSDFEFRLRGSYEPLDYCVQYRESDFNFVSRLMEQAGIYYFFEHENGKHTLVLADSIVAHNPVPGYLEMWLQQPDADSDELLSEDSLYSWTAERRVQPNAIALSAFDCMAPNKDLNVRAGSEREGEMPSFELYDYSGDYVDCGQGEEIARVRVEELDAGVERIRAESAARGLTCGGTFLLRGHPDEARNVECLLTAVELRFEAASFESGSLDPGDEPTCHCQLSMMNLQRAFRPPRTTPEPTIYGPQTAIVVGPKNQEIWTDPWGRVKVHFPWDREGRADEDSSCWIRVAQNWAGKKWGSMFLPRIGQEVIVEFLEGDPDRPIITGRVYNGTAQPPYALPEHATVSTIKSSSSKGGQGFNEIRFEDRKGSEQLFVHAERNHDVRVKNDRFETIGHDRHLVVDNDRFEHVKGHANEVVGADRREQIGQDHHLEVRGKQAVSVTGSHSFRVKGAVIEEFESGHSEKVDGSYYLKAEDVVIESDQAITFKVGANSIVIDATGVTLSGSAVTIDSKITKINSGPGSKPGAGDALALVAPLIPALAALADLADPGAMSAVKAEQVAKGVGKYGSTPIKTHAAGSEEFEETTWIEVELVDEDGAPVPGERYRVELPDGSTAEGALDEDGFARVEGVLPGDCKISFPDRESDAWAPQGEQP